MHTKRTRSETNTGLWGSIFAGCSGWFPGRLKPEEVNDFRGLTEAIIEE